MPEPKVAYDIEKLIKRRGLKGSERVYEVQSTYAKQHEEDGDKKYKQILEGNWRMEQLLVKLPDDTFSNVLTVIGSIFSHHGSAEAKKFADGLAITQFDTQAELNAARFAAVRYGVETGLRYLSCLRETHVSEALIKASGTGQKDSFYLTDPTELFSKDEKAGKAVLLAEKELAKKGLNPIFREEVFRRILASYSKSMKEGDEELAKFEEEDKADREKNPKFYEGMAKLKAMKASQKK
jgi:hypothetical protein